MKWEKEKIFLSLFFCVLISECNGCFTNNQVEFNKIKTGSSFYQECRCDEPSPGIQLAWFGPNNLEIRPLRPGTKSNIYSEWLNQDTYSVYISSISKLTSGAYTCMTVNSDQLFTKTYNVEAYDPPYFINTDETQYVVNDRDALITCEARGDTDLLISWHQDIDGPVEITDDEKYRVTPEGLHINKVTKEDSGIYRCTASDLETGEGIDKDISVEVISTPMIVELVATPDRTVAEGQSLSIACLATGAPHPEYTWTKITDEETPKNNETWKVIGNKIIFDEVVAEDRGTYECNASNTAGSMASSVHIEVQVAPNITEFNNVTAVEGSITQIICKANGRPLPRIYLTFIGEQSADQSVVSEVKNVSDTEAEYYVTFLRVNRSFEGTYLCNAENDIGMASEEMELSVLYSPHFDVPNEMAWKWKEKKINLSCEHHSNPKADITWRYLGNAVSIEEQVEINKIMNDKLHSDPLVIENKTLYGDYECTAKNKFGEAKKIIHLQEGFVPKVISNVSILNITSYSVTFSIEGPSEVNGPDIIGFQSEYDESINYNITDIHNNRTWSKDRPFKLDRLKANTSYHIRFSAINDVGNGEWSDIFDFITLERNDSRSVPEEPMWEEGVEELVKSDKILKWKSIESSDVDHYSIKYCPIYNGEFDDNLCKEEQIESAEEFDLNNMEANTTYSFELVAHNSLGNSSAVHIIVTIPDEEESQLSSGAIIGVAILVVFLCLVLLDVFLLLWRRQGVIASCCCKEKNKREVSINSRDKKGLLKDNTETKETLKRPSNGHKEYEYNKTTGIITGKHSSV